MRPRSHNFTTCTFSSHKNAEEIKLPHALYWKMYHHTEFCRGGGEGWRLPNGEAEIPVWGNSLDFPCLTRQDHLSSDWAPAWRSWSREPDSQSEAGDRLPRSANQRAQSQISSRWLRRELENWYCLHTEIFPNLFIYENHILIFIVCKIFYVVDIWRC